MATVSWGCHTTSQPVPRVRLLTRFLLTPISLVSQTVPFELPLQAGLTPRMLITITGSINPNPTRYQGVLSTKGRGRVLCGTAR